MKKHLQIDHSFVLRNLIMNLKYQIFFYKKKHQQIDYSFVLQKQ